LFGLLIFTEWVGLAFTLIELVITAILGLGLLRQSGQKFNDLFLIVKERGNLAPRDLVQSIGMILAGFCLCIPGLLTDTAGILLLGASKLVTPVNLGNRKSNPRSQRETRQSKDAHQTTRILEGEFEVTKDDQ
jgi:UPF0716 family protein affecting phage T7 exclusion